jgi:hypothetical protein
MSPTVLSAVACEPNGINPGRQAALRLPGGDLRRSSKTFA